MAYPVINTYYVNEDKIIIYWEATPKPPTVKKWNLYGTATLAVDFTLPNKGVILPGSFTLIKRNIPNCASSQTPNNILIQLTRDELLIGPEDTYYFMITPIDADDVEGPLELDNLHAVPLSDTYFVDEAGQPFNVTYRSFEVTVPPTAGWDSDRKLDIVNILGRPAKQLRLESYPNGVSGYTGYTFVKLNSFNNDYISVRHDEPNPNYFELLRGGLLVYSIYLHNPGLVPANIKIFFAG